MDDPAAVFLEAGHYLVAAAQKVPCVGIEHQARLLGGCQQAVVLGGRQDQRRVMGMGMDGHGDAFPGRPLGHLAVEAARPRELGFVVVAGGA